MTTQPSTCLYCGAERLQGSTRMFRCGSWSDRPRSNLCQEREAHNATREHLAEMTAIAEELAEQLTASMYKLPRVNCDCDQCSVLRRFEAIKKGIQ